MIEFFRVKGEKIQTITHDSLSATSQWIKGTSGVVWMRCSSPDKDDITILAELSGINLDELTESVEEEERAKVTVEKYVEIVYHVPVSDADGNIETIPLYMYIKGNFFITIEKKTNPVLATVARAMKAGNRRFLLRKQPGVMVQYILDKINDEYLRVIDRIGVRVDLFSESRELSVENIQKIYDSSVTLSYFNQALIANIEVLNNLRKSYFPGFTATIRREFGELYFDALQILDTEKIQRESVTNLFNLQSAMSAVRLNKFTKRITFFAVIIAVPTLISGLYGMNVPLPFANSQYTFFAIILLIIFLAVLSLMWFRLTEQ